MQERLHEAGKNPKTDVVEQALKVARITNRIDDVRTELFKNLEDLSFYTGEDYNAEELDVLYMNETGFEPVNFEKSEVGTTNLADKSGAKLEIEAVKTDFLDTENLPESEI
jgi:hypothetical protein